MRPGKSPFRELARTVLPVANSKLIAQLAQVSFLDKALLKFLTPIPSKSKKLPAQTQLNSIVENNRQAMKPLMQLNWQSVGIMPSLKLNCCW
jgi:flagellar hook assembly protein FlgD